MLVINTTILLALQFFFTLVDVLYKKEFQVNEEIVFVIVFPNNKQNLRSISSCKNRSFSVATSLSLFFPGTNNGARGVAH